MRSFSDPGTRFTIVRSESPIAVDGYALGEPKSLECPECGASVLLTAEPSPGIDEIGHLPSCEHVEALPCALFDPDRCVVLGHTGSVHIYTFIECPNAAMSADLQNAYYTCIQVA